MNEHALLAAAIQIPAWLPWLLGAFALGGALYAVLPELKKWAKSQRVNPVPSSAETEIAKNLINETVDVECPHEVTFLAMKRAFDKGQYDVARKLLEAAIEQKGPVDA